MDKAGYLKSLRSKLHRLPEHEIDAALIYYEEYFDEAGEENEQQVIQQLGPPSQVAAQILADLAIKDLDATPTSTKKNVSAIWLIILAILSAPLSLPLLATAIALIISAGAVVFSIVIAIVATVGGILFGGLAALISGFFIITDHWPTALLFIGIGLIITGIGVLIFPSTIRFIKKMGLVCVEGLAGLFQRVTRKRKGRYQ
ncbi:hypothetical protein AEA09_11660 [Lysinibacillus contaminans]|uniref:DUF1700 domain-containing protein n=1 Tax=Lysinibacillus contaminans TaxID=1293441 RepID=A0ABR5K335_9BACI|nr:DUF1700 domain-containing protein [Lysinibacillus contaminans]KOS69136.1 hypothetical protein AEA09_11660 [Lysinibacillus contaminans]